MTGGVGAAIVGVGGLGAPAAAALAGAGIDLTLIDPDQVELSNLPRQPLYGARDLGRAKAEVAAERLRAAHPTGVRIAARVERLERDSAARLLAGHAVIIDGTDSLVAKDLLNEVALALDVPLVHAGAVGLGGQLFTILPHRTACLRCLFPELPEASDLPTCQEAGVLGPVAGAVGIAAAREALAVCTGARPALADRLAILAGDSLTWRTVELRPNPSCPACRAA